jgi:hypothetical protein
MNTPALGADRDDIAGGVPRSLPVRDSDHLAKVRVAGSNPVVRSNELQDNALSVGVLLHLPMSDPDEVATFLTGSQERAAARPLRSARSCRDRTRSGTARGSQRRNAVACNVLTWSRTAAVVR